MSQISQVKKNNRRKAIVQPKSVPIQEIEPSLNL
jgi:hypothetical protein